MTKRAEKWPIQTQNPFADKAMSLSNALSSNTLIPGDSKMRDPGNEVGVSS